jgi:hypothetical protein
MSEYRLSPEMALLLCCADVDTERSRIEAATLARAVDHWDAFVEIAVRHAVVPLVDQQLARVGPGSVPTEVSASLRVAAQQSAVQSLRLAGDLVAVASALSRAAVDAIPFKGPTLAALLYGNLSLRQFQDLDILVYPEDVERARTVLFGIGYAPVLRYDKDQRASLQLSGHHEQFAHGETGTTIELHWSLNNRSLTHDSFEHHWWENCQEASIGGVSMRTLGVEQLILYLCLHGGKHSWGRLSWLCDFQRALAAYPNANWDRVWALAVQSGAVRMVGIGLTLVDVLLNGAVLTKVAASGRRPDADVERVSAVIANRLRDSNVPVPGLDFSVQLRSRDRRRDRIRYAWHILAEPHASDVSRLGLPRALHGMYFVLRPLRLTFKYLGRRLRPARIG